MRYALILIIALSFTGGSSFNLVSMAWANEASETVTLKVPNMTCGNCEKSIRDRVGTLDGVMSVTANHRQKSVVVKFNPAVITLAKIKEALNNLGFTVL